MPPPPPPPQPPTPSGAELLKGALVSTARHSAGLPLPNKGRPEFQKLVHKVASNCGTLILEKNPGWASGQRFTICQDILQESNITCHAWWSAA